MRTPTGDYRVDFFNKYGERVEGAAILCTSFVDAITIGTETIDHEKHSFTVMRCVHNSMDKED